MRRQRTPAAGKALAHAVRVCTRVTATASRRQPILTEMLTALTHRPTPARSARARTSAASVASSRGSDAYNLRKLFRKLSPFSRDFPVVSARESI